MADRDPKPPRPVARGTVKPLSDEELERLAEITPEDIEDAKAQWRRDASPEFRDLLDAEPVNDDPLPE